MYHFLYSIHKKLLKNTFDVTGNVDPTKEQIIDFCPMCNEQLEDRRVITLRKHEKIKHPKTEKQQVKDFYKKGTTQVIAIMIAVGFFVGIFFPINHFQQVSWEESLTKQEKEYLKFCEELLNNVPKISGFIFYDKEERNKDYLKRNEYVTANQKNFEKCHYSITYNSLGDKESRIEYFNSLDEEK